MERQFRDALEEDEVVYDHSQFGLLNNRLANDPLSQEASLSTRKVLPDRGRCAKLMRTAALCGAYISLGMCMAVTGPTLPFLKDQIGSTVAEISWIFTARSAGTLGGSFMGGLVLDKFNPYSIFFLTVAAMAFGTGAMPWCKHLWMLMLASIMVGIANGFLDTGASTVCLRLWGKESGPYMQAMHFAFAIGGTLAPLLVQAFIGETTALLQHSNITILPFSTDPPATSIRHIRAAIADQDSVDAFRNTTVKAILEDVTKNSFEVNITLSPNATNSPTEKPKRPKPERIDGAAIGPSNKFDNIPLPKAEPNDLTTTSITTVIGNIPPITTISSTTTPASKVTTIPNSTLVNGEIIPLTVNGTIVPKFNQSSAVVHDAYNPILMFSTQPVTHSTAPSQTTTNVVQTTKTLLAPSTTTLVPTITSTSAPYTITSTMSNTIALPVFPVETASTANSIKSRGKSRGQQLEEMTYVTTSPTTSNPEVIISRTSPSGGKTYSNYLQLFGVTQMHLLYTVVAIIVLHTAFTFLFFLCSSADNRTPSLATSSGPRKLSGEQPHFRPRSKFIFLALLSSFYLLYVGAEVVFAQFLTTFVLESYLHVSTSVANYVTTTFWVAFATARFGAIFFAHFTSPTVMLLFNLGLTTIGSLSLCVAGQGSIYVLYAGSALIGVGMASTFATGFVWTEKHLHVTNRISASFSIASAMGEMIFPTMTGALMEKSSMSLMYVVLVANLLCVATFLSARMCAKNEGDNRSGRGYKLAAQQVEEEESYLSNH